MAEDRTPERNSHADGTIPLTPPGSARPRGSQDRMLGQVIDGRFRLRAVLGEGGMGRVYLAEDEKLNRRRVALKLMGSALTMDPEFRQRFGREAALQANLPHPQIIQILDIGESAEGAYIVMEYSDGQCLSTLIRELGPRPLERALEITEQLLEILDFAHRQGVVHRDLKPSNILIEERAGREFVRVLDFGIAKLITKDAGAEHALTLTKAGHSYGTLGYMAPEQAKGEVEKLDHRADIYSLGIILYEMLTGQVPAPPEARTHPVRYAMWVVSNPVRPLRESHPGLDVAEDVDNIIRGALRRDPDKRYPSALAFLNAIRMFRRTAEASTVKRAPIGQDEDSDPRTGAGGGKSSAGSKPKGGPGAGSKLGWVAALVFLAAAALGWWKWWEIKDSAGPPPADRKLAAEADSAHSALKAAGIESTSLEAGIQALAAKAAAQSPPDEEALRKLREAETRAGELETAKNAAEAEAQTQAAAATQATAAAETARQEKDKVASELSLARSEIQRIQKDLATKTADLDTITDQATNLRRENETLRRQGGKEATTEIQRQLDAEKQRADGLQRTLNGKDGEIEGMRTRAESAERRKTDAERELEQARNDVQAKERRIEELMRTGGGGANDEALRKAVAERDQARQDLFAEQSRSAQLGQDARRLQSEVERLNRLTTSGGANPGSGNPGGTNPGGTNPAPRNPGGEVRTSNISVRNSTRDTLRFTSIVVRGANDQTTTLNVTTLNQLQSGSELPLSVSAPGSIEIKFRRYNNRGTPINSFDTERTLPIPAGGGLVDIKD